MSSIKKEEDGKYSFVVDIGKNPFTGKRRQIRRKGFNTIKEAKEAMKTILLKAEANRDLNNDISNAKFMDFLEQWIEHKKIAVQYSTYSRYKQTKKYLLEPYFQNIKIYQINENVLNNFILSLVKQGKAPSTIRRAWSTVRSALKKAAKKKGFNIEICEDILLPQMTNNSRVWTEEQINKFLNAPNFCRRLSRHYNASAFALLTGMRKQEVLGLRWKDIYVDEKVCHIQQTVTETSGGYKVLFRGKTDTSLGKVALPDKAFEYLRRQKVQQENDKNLLGDHYNDQDLVFCRKDGGVLKPSLLNNGFKLCINHIGLPYIRFHDLRHTHATYLLSKGINPKVVQERLRHKDIRTTLGIYGHVTLTMQKEAADLLDKSFN
ncbi:site-specific integrase [Halalkalibacter alkalisediminis]|uniref:Tyrosine-type recombinase/integrase n=1 Tax=Halalkalibacter alkalisediminis TaxID=935616 RepID=A0ABV6NG84_9BACI|nr:site-specific integrase [Halalkalibacter alkalisediminis]